MVRAIALEIATHDRPLSSHRASPSPTTEKGSPEGWIGIEGIPFVVHVGHYGAAQRLGAANCWICSGRYRVWRFPLTAADRRPHGRSKLDVRALEGPAVSASSAVNSRRNTRTPWCRRRPRALQICSIGSADRSRGTKERPPGMRKRAPECASTCSCRPPCGRWNSALYAAASSKLRSITHFLNRRGTRRRCRHWRDDSERQKINGLSDLRRFLAKRTKFHLMKSIISSGVCPIMARAGGVVSPAVPRAAPVQKRKAVQRATTSA
jgi:hypothetical protein